MPARADVEPRQGRPEASRREREAARGAAGEPGKAPRSVIDEHVDGWSRLRRRGGTPAANEGAWRTRECRRSVGKPPTIARLYAIPKDITNGAGTRERDSRKRSVRRQKSTRDRAKSRSGRSRSDTRARSATPPPHPKISPKKHTLPHPQPLPPTSKQPPPPPNPPPPPPTPPLVHGPPLSC